MLFTTASVAVLGFASYASAHMKMSKPLPYANDQLDNSPLHADGSNFPCKMTFDTTTPSTAMALGSTQPLEFIGGATHGGGSCQVSITYDNPPNKNSVFKVIHSIEGGCPTRNNVGNIGSDASAPDPDTYSFTIPTDLPTGKATLAWTWFNKVGNREMYMNCAPIDLTSGASKRTAEEDLIVRDINELVARDQAAFSALPDMFTANIMNIGNDGCGTKETVDTVFPNPGSSVDKPGASSNFGPPVGTCKDSSGSSGSSGPASSAAAAAPSETSAPAVSPGVFATVAPSNGPSPTQAAASSPAPVAATTLSPVASAATQAPAASPSSAPASSPGTTGATGTMAAGSACTPEGLWNCIDGTSFQQCGSGTWSVVQSLAAGTTCTPGQSAAIDISAKPAKRAIRFSSEHVRRHVRRSS